MDVDLLCFAGCVQSVDAGFVSYESEFSLAKHYRKAVESGQVTAHEHACYTVISALRAASAGIPFMPVRGLMISDLIDANSYFETVTDPFGSGEVHVVKALCPDVCIIHVQEAERNGNAAIAGPQYEDILMTRAAKRVILTAETIVPDKRFSYAGKKADIPHFLVDAVVHVPQGAAPCACSGRYDINRTAIERFKKLQTQEELEQYLEDTKQADRMRHAGYERSW
jgi:glutaconate CoA-transferase subunit A